MTVNEFEDKLNVIRAKNGWRIDLSLSGIWEVSVYKKETNELLASTGSTRLQAILVALEIPFDQPPWV